MNTTSPLASVDQVRWFHEEGGEAVSFGSDAHQPAAVGQQFDLAVDVVEAAGFRPGRDRVRLLAPLTTDPPTSTSPLRNLPLGSSEMTSRRVVIALGGNAMTGPDGSATPGAQRDAIREASGHIADVVASGVEVVLTHGNGPQVGNLLVKNEMAAHVVPPVPLDWNVAQTQATIAFTLADELDAALERPRPARSAPPAWSPARSSTPTTRTSASRRSRSAASSRARRRNGSSRSARSGRTAARRAGAASSPRPSRSPSSTPPPSTRSPRPASSSSAPAAAASR